MIRTMNRQVAPAWPLMPNLLIRIEDHAKWSPRHNAPEPQGFATLHARSPQETAIT